MSDTHISYLESEILRLTERVKHLECSLRFIAKTCIEDSDTAQFACRAAFDPPTAFPPSNADYEIPWDTETVAYNQKRSIK